MTRRISTLLVLLTIIVMPVFAQDEDEPLTATEGSITVTVPVELADEVTAETFETAPLNEDTPPGDEFAANTLFTFDGYPIEGFVTPSVAVYDTTDFEAVGWEDTLTDLQTLLEERPENIEGTSLPYLPEVAGEQLFFANASYLDFDGGTGVRYLTVNRLDVAPIVEGEVFYTYQGLTDDGSAYISASFPVETGILLEEIGEDFDYDAFAAEWETYIDELVVTLGDQADEDFTPDLSTLDTIIEALVVENTTNEEAVETAEAEMVETEEPEATETEEAAATEAVETNGTPEPTIVAEYERFSFEYPLRLASEYDFVVNPAAPFTPDTPLGDEYPSNVTFSFTGYPVEGAVEPTVVFYNIEQPEVYGYQDIVTDLQTLLEERPDLNEPETLPYSPLISATQTLQGRAEYLDFNGGSGIRYLTRYAQEAAPALEGEVFYTFQGLTEDGRYLVSVNFPVTTGILDTEIAADFDSAAFAETEAGITQNLERTLTAQPAEDFFPDLTLLDSLVQSITVGE